jgi:DNA-damage-inducible protein D
MEDNSLTPARQKTFEALKQINPYGAKHRSARDLPPLLGYKQWRRFEDAVKRAKTSCRRPGASGPH